MITWFIHGCFSNPMVTKGLTNINKVMTNIIVIRKILELARRRLTGQ